MFVVKNCIGLYEKMPNLGPDLIDEDRWCCFDYQEDAANINSPSSMVK